MNELQLSLSTSNFKPDHHAYQGMAAPKETKDAGCSRLTITDISNIRQRIRTDTGLNPLDKFRMDGQETTVCISFVDALVEEYGEDRGLITDFIDNYLELFLACKKENVPKFKYIAKSYLKGRIFSPTQ